MADRIETTVSAKFAADVEREARILTARQMPDGQALRGSEFRVKSPKSIFLRARWIGDAPEPGHYVKTPTGRVAYLIDEVRRIPGMPAFGSRRLRLRCWRVPPSEVPPDAVIHPWRWTARTRRIARA